MNEMTSLVMEQQQIKLLDLLLIEDNPVDARLVSRAWIRQFNSSRPFNLM